MKETNKNDMRDIILNFPSQFKVGIEAAKNIKVQGKFKAVLVCGMGGSALPGNILSMWWENYKINLPLYVHRNYSLPYHINKDCLVICISYSGDTEETLSAFQEALKRKNKIIVITSGGKLKILCEKNKIPFALITPGYQTRMALGYLFGSLIKILANCKIINDNLANIYSLERNLKPKSLESAGKNLAQKLIGKTPLVYASSRNRDLARLWKIKFNENSKIPAFYNYFPELNHNELTGFKNPPKKFHIIILRDKTDHPRILKRMEITADIAKTKGLAVDFIEIKDKDMAHKIFSNIILSDWATYYLAKHYKINPIETKLQEEFKVALRS